MSDDLAARGIEANRAHWDEATALHARSELYDLDGFRAGRDDIRPFEHDELGPVAGLELLHLQCHLGTDTLSWARHGARVVGLDFSQPAIDVARQLAADCGLDAEFVCADVHHAADALGGRTFDVVYTGIGALGWLPDVGPWAAVVQQLLKPGGVVYLVEVHPIAAGLDGDGRTIVDDVSGGAFRRYDGPGGTYAAPDADLVNVHTYERNHSVADVVSAVLDAGLVLEQLHEQSYSVVPWPWAVRGADGFYRSPPGAPRVPMTYSLRARRPYARVHA